MLRLRMTDAKPHDLSLRHLLMIWTILFLAFSNRATGTSPLHNVLLDDPMVQEVYDFVDRTVLKYQLTGLLKNRRPYTHGDISKIFEQLRSGDFELTSIEQARLEKLSRYFSDASDSLLQMTGEDYRFKVNLEPGMTTTHRTEPAEPSGTEYAWQLRPMISGGVGDDFAFLSDLRFFRIDGTLLPDTVRVETEIRQGRNSKDYNSALAPAYGKFKLPWFNLLLGKNNVSWGPGRRGNLLLSANALPMDMFQIDAQYKNAGFTALTGIAESVIGTKVFSAHRFDISLWNRLHVGLAETLIVGEDDFEVRFLNPFTIYLVTELSGANVFDDESERESGFKASLGNVMISGDFELRLLRNLAVYGELLIDDYQPHYGINSIRNWASKFGIQLGAHVVDPLSIDNADVRMEYVFINQFTYTHKLPINEYTHFDKVIGHEIGSDSDALWLNFAYWLTDSVSGGLSYELQRHGEGGVSTPHPRGAPIEDYWEFLSGITEATHAFSIEGQYHTVGSFLVKGRYTFSHIVNVNNEKGIDDNQHEIVLTALYRL